MNDTNRSPVFRGLPPRRLLFGTSGLRGLVSDITDLEAYVNTRGFLEYLAGGGEAGPDGAVAIAGDLRPSTHSPGRSILGAVARAVADSGFEPVHCGRIPTPALVLHGLERGIPGIMVTGSHIPFDRNGIKFSKPGGEVLKSDEADIVSAIERVRAREYANDPSRSLFADSGMFREGEQPGLPPVVDDAQERYARRYLDFFPADALSGARIVVYQHSAVGRDLVVEILRRLGAAVYPVDRTDRFVPIDTEAVSAEMLDVLQRIADRARAVHGDIDAVVSTDGDSDRPLFAAIDAGGRVRFVSGDLLGILVADYLDADAVVVPVSATDAIERHFLPRGVRPVRTRIGSPWVIAEMAVQPGTRRVGWEANGGFLTGSDLDVDGRRLAALPTRDAVLPIAAVMHHARRSGATPVELLERLPRRHTRAGLLDGVPSETGRRLVADLSPENPAIAQAAFSGGVATALDSAGRSIPLRSGDQELLVGIHERLAGHFGAARGFGPIARIDFRDGIRMCFDNGDIAHVRPSGNAPQLRIYAIADTEARAAAIVEAGLAEPDGILREMERL